MKCYFFGTFNPIHRGHLEIARQIKEKGSFEQVVFVPAFCPPHKDNSISAYDRLKMIQLSAGIENVSDIEFSLPLPSYSFRTILELKKRDNTEKINFIMGYDSFFKIESWKNPDILKKNINFIIIPRRFGKSPIATFEHLKKRGWNFKIEDIDFIDVSSNMIRDKIQKNESINGLVTPEVEEYIYEHGLYKNNSQRVLK